MGASVAEKKTAKGGLQSRINKKIAEIDAIASELPGVVIIHYIKDGTVVYMSKRGQEILGVDLDELKEMGTEYYNRFFNPEDAKDYVPKILGLLERNNNDEIISFFQQVRPEGKQDFDWYMSTVKIFMRDDEGKPILTITMAFPIDPEHHFTSKVQRLLDENLFLRKNYDRFSLLGNRERDVLKLMALGKSSPDIAEELFISQATVETHKKNIKQKLNTGSAFEISQYARAFDLI